MRKYLALFLTLALLLALIPAPRANALGDDEKVLRVGLSYGSNALDEAKLQNISGHGSGYLVGYMNENLDFVSFGYLADTVLSVVFGDTYHVLDPNPYPNYSSAADAASRYGSAFVRFADGEFYVLIGSYSSPSAASDAAASYGGSFTTCACHSGTFSVKNTDSGKTLFQFRSSSYRLAVMPVFPNGTWYSDDGSTRAITWHKANQYMGIFEFFLSGTRINVVNVVTMSDYIKGIVPYEMSSSWPLEALKAQAICARTYAVANLGKHSKDGFDLCASTDCQAYRGTGSANASTDAAVEQTAGMYVTYEGEPINAVYCSSNGGATEDSENIWSLPLGYLRAVRDPYEASANPTNYSWEYTITLSKIESVLRDRGKSFSGSIVLAYAEYTDAGNVAKLHFIDSAGNDIVYRGESCRSVFNTSSSGIKTYSQRFIFEDAAAPRVTSCDQITNIAGSGGSPSVGSGSASAASVLTSGGLRSASELYGSSVPILSASGKDEAVGFYTTSGGSVSAQAQLSASSLQVPTSCSGTFIIRGSGWGHNLGMSQYGAKAMAEQGFSAQDIIRFYYTDVTIEYMN